MPTRQDWLLRFIAGDDDGWIDRIRIMKGMFLFQKEGGTPSEIDYHFRPYDYGPFTAEIYRDIAELSQQALVAQSLDGQSYRATEAARDLLAETRFPSPQEAALRAIRSEVAHLSFRGLLKRVYTAYPESAERSVARDVLG